MKLLTIRIHTTTEASSAGVTITATQDGEAPVDRHLVLDEEQTAQVLHVILSAATGAATAQKLAGVYGRTAHD